MKNNNILDEVRDLNAEKDAIIAAFDGLIYVCSQDYRVEFMNERMIARTGHDGRGELCFRALHNLDAVCPWCVNDRVFRGETVRWEVKSPKDERWYYIVNTPIYRTNGSISKQAMIMDITDRKQLEEDLLRANKELERLVEERTTQLRKANRQLLEEIDERRRTEADLLASEKKYRSVIDNIGVGVALISPQMEILTLNRKMQQWFPHLDTSLKPFCYASFNNPPLCEVCSYCPTIKSLKDGGVHEAITYTPKGRRIKNFRIVASAIEDENGKVIAAIEMVEDLTEQMRIARALQKREEDLGKKTLDLEEVNTAMKVLLKRREEDRGELEMKVLSNVRELVLPYIDRLKRGIQDDQLLAQVKIIEKNLENITSPFLQCLTALYKCLTPREIQIANLVKDGLSNKEIAAVLCTSIRSVEFHRDNIRKKCGLSNKKTNLHSYLISLS